MSVLVVDLVVCIYYCFLFVVCLFFFFFFQAEDGIRDTSVTGVQTCALPILAANEPGCDDLHWLDGSVFRPCCDMHDACYYAATPPCTQRSWWYWGSWSCDRCNIIAFGCFIGGGIHPPYIQYP